MVVTWIIMFPFFVFFYSRVAQMYREKLATLAARALQQYGLQVQCYSTSFHLNLLLGCSVLLGVLCVFMCMSVWHNLQFSRDGLPFASHLLNILYPYMAQLTYRQRTFQYHVVNAWNSSLYFFTYKLGDFFTIWQRNLGDFSQGMGFGL